MANEPQAQAQATKGGKKGEAASSSKPQQPSPPQEASQPQPQPQPQPEPGTLTPPLETTALAEFDYGEDAGAGYENQSMADRKLPMYQLLQANSPLVAESKGKVYAGQWLNTVTGEITDEVYVVPAVTDHCFTLWIPRDDGGGFRGRFPTNAKVVLDAIARNEGRSIGKLPVPMPPDKKGKPQPVHELVETFEVYGIVYDPTSGEVLGFAVIPFTSTKIKVYRAWNTALASFSPTIGGKKIPAGRIPLFAYRVKMTSTSDSNAQGTFMVPVLEPEGGEDLKMSLLPKNDLRYLAAKQLHADVQKGLARGAYETMEQEPGVDPEAGVPF